MHSYPKVGVGAVIFNDKNEILLILRKKNPEAYKWSIPGGKVEPFEYLEDATIREIKEEIDIDIKIEKLICTAETINIETNEHWISLIYSAEKIANPSPKINEDDSILALNFFPLDKLPADIACFTLPAIDYYLKNKE